MRDAALACALALVAAGAFTIGATLYEVYHPPIPPPNPQRIPLATASDIQRLELEMHRYMLRIDTALSGAKVITIYK